MGRVAVRPPLAEPLGEARVPLFGFEHRSRVLERRRRTPVASLARGRPALARRLEQQPISVPVPVGQRRLRERVEPDRRKHLVDPRVEEFVLSVRRHEPLLLGPEPSQLLERRLRVLVAVPRLQPVDPLGEVVPRKQVRIAVRSRRGHRLAHCCSIRLGRTA